MGQNAITEINETNYREFLGREVVWKAPATDGNETYEGAYIIDRIDWNSKNHPVSGTHLEGDRLDMAFVQTCFNADGTTTRVLAYGDDDRFVGVERIKA